MNPSDISRTLTRLRSEEVERTLLTMIEAIEGRVPTNAEAAEHGRRVICSDGSSETYEWRGQKLFTVTPTPGFGWRINT